MNLKRWIAITLSVTALFGFGLYSPVVAAEVEKETFNQNEITELAAKERADASALETVEAGEMNPGAGIFILVVIGIAVIVASD
ncbi:MAG: hypothetical protein ACI8UO_006013 [Verrucomicrobiales bacterium]|jgi:hypothetical protein